MKFLILQDIPVGKSEEPYCIACCIARALQRVGFEAKAIDTRTLYESTFKQYCEKYDVLLITQNYGLENLNYIKNFNGIKLFWSIDSHKIFDGHKNFYAQNHIDLMFVSGVEYADKFKKWGCNVCWLPNCYPSDLIKPTFFRNRPIKFGFCGSWGNRRQIIEKLHLEIGMKIAIHVIADDMANELCSYQIGWNRNESDDLNFRTFEVPGSGAMLLTNNTPGLYGCFDPGEEIIIYEDIDDCIKKAKYYMEHDSERHKIAINGYLRARKEHSYDARILSILYNII